MTTPEDFSNERINFLKVCHVAKSIVPRALRSVFKREWNVRYHASHGPWLDTAQNGIEFYNDESTENQRKFDLEPLDIIKKGNTYEWDCNCLLFCILDSTSIGLCLSPQVKSSVKSIRDFQSKVYAQVHNGRMTDNVFESTVQSLVVAFSALGLATKAIEEIKGQTSFPTLELCTQETKCKEERATCEAFEQRFKEVQEESSALGGQPIVNFQSFVILPPKPNHKTIRRTHLETKILTALENLERSKQDEITAAFVSGSSGSGKSHIAREIGQQFLSNKLKSSAKAVFVMTLNAENLDALLQSYTTFSRRLRCPEHAVSRVLESEQLKIEEKLACFKNLVIPHVLQYSSWLMILDNVTDVNSVSEFLPRPGSKEWGQGQLLVTIRDPQLLPMGNVNSCHFSVSRGMQPDVAVDLLSNVSTVTGDREVKLQVAKFLEFQPLALACAAVFMRNMTKIGIHYTWITYLEVLQERKKTTEKAVNSKCAAAYPEATTAAVALLVEEESKRHTVLKHVYQFLSLLAPEPLLLEHVVKYVAATLGVDHGTIETNLVTTSPLIVSLDSDSTEIRVHEVVHDVLRMDVFPILDIEEYVFKIASLLSSFAHRLDRDVNHNTIDYGATEKLCPHLTVLAEHVNVCWSVGRGFAVAQWTNCTVIDSLKVIGNTCNFRNASNSVVKALEIAKHLAEISGANIERIQVAQISSLLGDAYRSVSKLKEAKEMYETALKFYQEEIIDNLRTLIAKGFNDLGNVHLDLAEYKEATNCHKQCLDIRKQIFGPFHHRVAESLTNLGNVYHHLAQYENSKQCHSEALDILRTVHHGGEDLSVSDSLNNLGNAHNDLAEYVSAVQCYEESLSIRKNTYGKNHPKVADVLDNIGSVYKSLAKYDAAKKYHEEALNIRRQVHEVNYLDVANSLDNLGTVHQAVADFHAAKVCYEQALAIRQTVYPDDHPAVAMSLSNLGVIEEDLANYDTAKKFHQRALEIREKVHGRDHPAVGRSLYNLGAVYLAVDDYCQAKECFTEALRIRKKVHGPEHPKVATCLEGLGIVYRELAELEEAQSCLKEALAIKQKTYNHDHPSVASSLDHLGTVQQIVGKHDAAKELYEEALAIRQKVCGESTPDVAVSFSNLGLISRALTNYQTAKEYLVKALSINQRVYGTDHPVVADCLGNLGVVHEDLDEHEAAKTCQEESLAIMQKVHCNDHDTVANGLHNLGNIHNKLAEYGAAKRCHKKAMAIRLSIYSQNHPLVADSFFALGIAHHHLSEHEAAMECYKRALAMRQGLYGCDHACVAASFDNLGCLLHELKQNEAAKACHEQALTIRQKLYSTDHPTIASSLYNLAADHLSLNEYNKAEQCHLTALEMKQRLHGCHHPTVADSFNNLGIIFMLQGEYVAAKQYHQVALSIREQSNESDPLDVASSLHNLGLVHQCLGENELSRDYLSRALTIRQKLQGSDHPIVGYTFDSLALVHQALAEYDEAIVCHREALEIRQRVHGDSDPTVADSLFKLGVVHLEKSDYKDSKEYLEKALAVSQICGADSHMVGLIHHNLGVVYRNLNEIDLAKKHLAQALSILQKSLGSEHPEAVQVADKLKDLQSLSETPKKCVVM